MLNTVSLNSLRPLQVVLGIAYFILTLGVIVLAARATRWDPTDVTIYRERQALIDGVLFNNEGLEYYCSSCDTHVQESSKHCGSCNRCVNDFDHHCKWLNNCIGGGNYPLFFKLIITVFLQSLV